MRTLDPDLAVWNMSTMDEAVTRLLARERFTSVLLALFAAVAVALAAVGVHGVLSFLVSRRRREIGVRLALGASRSEVLRLVVSQGMGLAAAGLALGLGLAGAVAASRLLSGLLFGVSPLDPRTYAAVTAALLACALPARRAARVDPASARHLDGARPRSHRPDSVPWGSGTASGSMSPREPRSFITPV